MAEHVALLGDSIFDNLSYTKGLPDVITHLRRLLPEGFVASLIAVDGSTTEDLQGQVSEIPPDVTRAVVSIGGNDALLNADILNFPVTSTREALLVFSERIARFEARYRDAIGRVVARVPATTICTVYNGNLPDEQSTSAQVVLMMFNDVILRVAFQCRLPVIDLRTVCTEPGDYANSIEPSGQGREKIAQAIVASLGVGHAAPSRSCVFAG